MKKFILVLSIFLMIGCKTKKIETTTTIDVEKEINKIGETTTSVATTTSLAETTTTILIEEIVIKKPIRYKNNKLKNKKVSSKNDKIKSLKDNEYIEIKNNIYKPSNEEMREHIADDFKNDTVKKASNINIDENLFKKYLEEVDRQRAKEELKESELYILELRKRAAKDKKIKMTNEEYTKLKKSILDYYGIDLDSPDNIDNYKTKEEKEQASKKIEKKYRTDVYE